MKTQQQNPTVTACAVSQVEKINSKIYIIYESMDTLRTYSTDCGIEFEKESYDMIALYSDKVFIAYAEDIIFQSSNLEEFNNYIKDHNNTNIMLNHE